MQSLKAQVLNILAASATAGVAIAAAVALPSPAPAAAQPAPTAHDQAQADVVYVPEREEYLLVWVEDRGAGNRVFAKRVRANGLPVGGRSAGDWELTGATGTGAAAGQKGDQQAPAIIGDLVVWSEKAPGAADYNLYAQRLFDNGRANGRPRLILDRPGDQMYPDVIRAARGGEEYLVVWSENTNDAGDVMGVRLNSALLARGAPFAVASGPSRAEDPTIARDLSDNDSLLVLFTDDRAGNKDIYGMRILESGLPRGGAGAGDFPVIQGPADAYAPSIVATQRSDRPGGRTASGAPGSDVLDARGLVAWTTDDAVDGPDVLGQRLFANGLPLGTPFGIAGGPGVQAMPAVTFKVEPGRTAGDLDAEWLAVWAHQPADAASTLDVHAVEIEINGISRRPERALVAD